MGVHPIAMTPFWNRACRSVRAGREPRSETKNGRKRAYEGVVLAADVLGGAAVISEGDVGAVDADGDVEVADRDVEVGEVLLHLLGIGLQHGA